MPLDLPHNLVRRIELAASARGVTAEQVVIEAVEAQLGSEANGTGHALSSLADELRRIAFDGSLRADIDAILDDPELAVG